MDSALTVQEARHSGTWRPRARRRRVGRLNADVGTHIALFFLAVFALAPLLWLVSIALRPPEQTYVVPQPLIPTELTLENVRESLVYVPKLLLYYRNSFIITGGTVALVVLAASMAGYAVARLRFPGRNLMFWTLTITMFMPAAIVLPGLYEYLSSLHLNDTMLGLILAYAGWYLGFGTFIMRGVFSTIPGELEEAARIDGASPFQIFTRIMLPLARSGMIVVAIFTFVPVWGEYLWAFTLTQSHDAMPMSVAIKFFDPSPASGKYTFNLAAAASLMMFIPAMAVYVMLQRWFTRGLTEGALKF